MIISDSDRQQREGLERLQEARDFAHWSKKDRESKLPKLTEEQRQQMRNYLQLVEEHGWTSAFKNPNGDGCEGGGCPVLSRAKKAVATVTGSSPR